MESKKTVYDLEADRRYLEVLARQFPTIADASTEIINLQAIMNLPKGTEHFLADIHGENEAFQHVLKNASGNVLRKVNDLFADTLSDLPRRIEQVHALQGAQDATHGLLLHHPGAAP